MPTKSIMGCKLISALMILPVTYRHLRLVPVASITDPAYTPCAIQLANHVEYSDNFPIIFDASGPCRPSNIPARPFLGNLAGGRCYMKLRMPSSPPKF